MVAGIRRCPALSIAAFVSARLWKAALSTTMTAASGLGSCRIVRIPPILDEANHGPSHDQCTTPCL